MHGINNMGISYNNIHIDYCCKCNKVCQQPLQEEKPSQQFMPSISNMRIATFSIFKRLTQMWTLMVYSKPNYVLLMHPQAP
jgi:hypothetical protein